MGGGGGELPNERDGEARCHACSAMHHTIAYHLLTESVVITGKSQTEALMY